jgi:flagellar biosynthesis GTPase FlhF
MAARSGVGIASGSRGGATSIREYFCPALSPQNLNALLSVARPTRSVCLVSAVGLSFPPWSNVRTISVLPTAAVDIPPDGRRPPKPSECREHSPITPTGQLPSRASDEDVDLHPGDEFSTPSPPQSPCTGPDSCSIVHCKRAEEENSLQHLENRGRSVVSGKPEDSSDDSLTMLEAVDLEAKEVDIAPVKMSRSDSDFRPSKKRRLENSAFKVRTDSQLHPFFSRTAAAVARSTRINNSRPSFEPAEICPVDPWSFPGTASVHVNSPDPCKSLSLSASVLSTHIKYPALAPWHPPATLSRLSVNRSWQKSKDFLPSNSQLPDDDGMWAEKYRCNGLDALDRLNQSCVRDLTEWLAPFFSRKECTARDSPSISDNDADSGSDQSSYKFCREDIDVSQGAAVENIALLTGPAGSGKTTIARLAAKALGLTVIEINAATCCRTGKRIKDYVGEALVTHRVRNRTALEKGLSGQEASVTQNDGCNSLIVFEEVDELHGDERGFWGSIMDLAETAGARRPIVLTANRLSADMRPLFGSCAPEEHCEISNVINGMPSGLFAPSFLDLFKHIRVCAPRTKKLFSALRSLAKTERVPLSKFDVRTLTGCAAAGDVRGAINALQFWSLGRVGEETNVPQHSILNSVLHLNVSNESEDMVFRAQEALWTGAVEDWSTGKMSAVASQFRICGNSGRMRLRAEHTSPNDVNRNNYRCLSAWVEHCDIISLADVYASSLNNRCSTADSRLTDEVTGYETGFAGAAGLYHASTALEAKSLGVFNSIVDASFPRVDDSDESMSFYYSFAAMTSSTGGQMRVSIPDAVPPASPLRVFVTDTFPMVRRFAAADFEARNQTEASSTNESLPRRLRLRSLRSSIHRNHFSTFGLSENTSSWLRKSSTS